MQDKNKNPITLESIDKKIDEKFNSFNGKIDETFFNLDQKINHHKEPNDFKSEKLSKHDLDKYLKSNS